MRIGHGFDLHRLAPGHELIVGGVHIDHPLGCVAHSDGDVVYHAVTDAVLGALGCDDIGQLFPNDDPRWRSEDSKVFVAKAVEQMRTDGYRVANLDATVILERPKLAGHKQAIRKKLAALLDCSLDRVNVKGKTHEQVDTLGRGEAIACHVVVLLTQQPAATP